MSLINDMLRDLDSRRKHDQQGKTFTELPIAVKGKSSLSFRWWLLGGGLLLVGAIVWLSVSLFLLPSRDLPEITVIPEANRQPNDGVLDQAPEPEPSPRQFSEEQAQTMPETVSSENPEAIVEPEKAKSITKLLSLVVSESRRNARLLLSFDNLPDYRLEQDGHGYAQSKLVINFSEIQLGDNLEIPEPTGGMLERISLRPQQKRLQLLVDLRADSTVESYELKNNNDSGYSLQIDIKPVSHMMIVTQNELQDQEELPAEYEELLESNSVDQIFETSPESRQIVDTSHLNKSENRIDPDKQAYSAGVEQMREGSFAAAENSFSRALKITPTFTNARLQLIATLQQQNKLVQAEEQMREGMTQAPESVQLRKVYARFLMSNNHNLEAIKVLRAQPVPAIDQDLEYYALLAALLQETGQFATAAQAYAGLLQLRPETAIWWFGLGVSMDQNGDFDQARNAYRRALALPGLSADVQKYMQSRLQVL
jgi:Flp pilus assembly protein TadD